MFLTDLINKRIFSGKTAKGICCGVGVSLKTHAVKYLLCANALTPTKRVDFCVSISAVENIGESIRLSQLRPLRPQRCANLFIGSPIYSFDGSYLGKITDLELREFIATRLFSDGGEIYSINAVSACQDAVILKKEQPYPLGQRIPAPVLPLVTEKKESVVTKGVLRTAIKRGALIRLTLSLPPFIREG